MEQNVKELPQIFHQVKKDFMKYTRIFLNSKQVQEKDENGETINIDTLESLATLWACYNELEEFLLVNEQSFVEMLKTKMDKEKTYEALLPEFGIKVVFDQDANWFFREKMTKEDWTKTMEANNKKYLAELKEKQNAKKV